MNTSVFTEAVEKAFASVRDLHKGAGAKARLRVEEAKKKNEPKLVMSGEQIRLGTRAQRRAEKKHQLKIRRSRAARQALESRAEFLAASQAGVLAGRIGNEEMRRNVYRAVRGQVTQEVIAEMTLKGEPRFGPVIKAEVDARLEAAGITL